MKHKHYEMGVAKLANKNLVQFIKMGDEWENAGLSDKFISFSEEYEYFLCLPQHEEACLRWLNGGEAQVREFVPSAFVDIAWNREWSIDCGFMVEDWVLRIKPKKEKRWLRYNSKGVLQNEYIKKPDCANKGDQLIEIEVEV